MKKKKVEMEQSAVYGEVRAIPDEETGTVEGYLTKWDTVDDWGTTFKKGAFTATFKKRGPKGTRLIWNHRELAGKILELREDSYGPFVKAQFNLETEVGKTAYAHVKAGDVNCFSFGFNITKDQWKGQVREILAVDMLECGPVVFEANNKAKVTGARQKKDEGKRSTDFDETQAKKELNSKGGQLFDSLSWTIDDIFYIGNNTPAEIISMADTAISKFHVAYVEWLKEYYAQSETRGTKEIKPPSGNRNSLQVAVNLLDTERLTCESTLTSDEVATLKKGVLLPLEARARLESANEDLFKAHQETRAAMIETLCDELRATTFTEGETERIEALLGNHKKPSGIADTINFLHHLQNTF